MTATRISLHLHFHTYRAIPILAPVRHQMPNIRGLLLHERLRLGNVFLHRVLSTISRQPPLAGELHLFL